jgi:hypothetical protein
MGQDDTPGVVEPEHKHQCIIATEHDSHTLCLCSCGATRDMATDLHWDLP